MPKYYRFNVTAHPHVMARLVRATGRGTVLEWVARTKPAHAKAGAGP